MRYQRVSTGFHAPEVGVHSPPMKRTPAEHALIAAALDALADEPLGAPLPEPAAFDPVNPPAYQPALPAVARSLGLTVRALRQWALSSYATENYPTACAAYHHARIIDADGALEDADNNVEVTKRNNQAKLARHDAERRLSKLWGQKQEITKIDNTPPPDLHEVARRMAYIMANAARGLAAAQAGAPGAMLPQPDAMPDAMPGVFTRIPDAPGHSTAGPSTPPPDRTTSTEPLPSRTAQPKPHAAQPTGTPPATDAV